MSKRFRLIAAPFVAVLLFLALGAGSCEQQGKRDAPINTDLQDNQAPLIVNSPDTFMNFALKCVDADLLVAHTRDAAPVVVSNSSACAPGEAEKLGIPRVRNVVPKAG